MVSKKRFHYLCEDGIEKSVPHDHCLSSRGLASLVMPFPDPQDRFFYLTLTLMMNSYNLIFQWHHILM